MTGLDRTNLASLIVVVAWPVITVSTSLISTSYVERQNPHDENAHAQIHAIDEWIFEESRKPRACSFFALRLLQFLQNPSDATHDTSNGSGRH